MSLFNWQIEEYKLTPFDKVFHSLDGVYSPAIMQMGFKINLKFSQDQVQNAWNEIFKAFPKLKCKIHDYDRWIEADNTTYFIYEENEKTFTQLSLECQDLKYKFNYNAFLQVSACSDGTRFLMSFHHALLDGYGFLGVMRYFFR